MKKKLKLISIVICVALISVFSFTACEGIFKLDEERYYKQTVATVSYGGMTSTVTRGALLEYFNNYAGTYIQYYGYTAERCLDTFTTSMSRDELRTMLALEYFYGEGKTDGLDLSEASTYLNAPGGLNDYEKVWVIQDVNKQFKDGIDAAVKALVTERNKNAEKTQEQKDKEADTDGNGKVATGDEKEDEARKTAPKPVENAFDADKYATETPAYWADLLENIVRNDRYVAPQTKPDKGSDEEQEEKDKKKAWEQVNKNLKKQYKDYEYFYVTGLRARLVAAYERKIKAEAGIVPTEQEIVDRYIIEINKNVPTVKDKASYETALTGTTNTYYRLANKYVTVRSMLISFSEAQKAEIETLKKKYTGDSAREQYLAARDLLARDFVGLGGVDEGKNENYADTGIRVKVSNPDYDADKAAKDDSKKMYTAETYAGNGKEKSDDDYLIGVKYSAILEQINDDIQAATAANAGKSAQEIYTARLRAFDTWMYKVGDDPGMFDSDGKLKEYVISPANESTSYVAEYIALARAVAANSNSTLGALGNAKVGDLPVTESLTANGAKQVDINGNFTVSGKAQKGEKVFDIYTVGELSYVVNDFGIHIVMVTSEGLLGDQLGGASAAQIPGFEYYAYNSNPYFTTSTDTEREGYILGLDYTIDLSYHYDTFTKYEPKTVRQIISDLIKTDAEYNAYTAIEKAFFTKHEDAAIKRNNAMYETILKQVKKAVG